jgi:hypothetical protein
LVATTVLVAATAFVTGLATGLAGAFVSALRAEAAGATFAPPDGFDFATVFSTVFLDFATALAMADDNPKEERRCAPYTTLGGSAQAAKPVFPGLQAKGETS